MKSGCHCEECGQPLNVENAFDPYMCKACAEEMDEAAAEFADENEGEDYFFNDDMDGDFDSGMRDAGYGNDEDYGNFGRDE